MRKFGASTVIDRDVELHTAILSRVLDCVLQFSSYLRRQSIHVAHAGEANVVAHDLGKFTAQVDSQETPQCVDLSARALPVLDRKSIERERLNAKAATGFDSSSDRFNAGLVACCARQTSAASPAAIAIHNDGDV